MGKLLANKGLFYSTLILVLFFLFYLLVNSVLQRNSIADAEYVGKFEALVTHLDGDFDVLERELTTFKDGGLDRLAENLTPIDEFLAPTPSNINELINAVKFDNTTEASSKFNELVGALNRHLQRKQDIGRYLQIAAAVITMLLYLLTVVPVISRASQQKESEVVVQKETQGIMSTVSEGLFLLDKDHNIGIEQSASLKEMFKSERDLEGDFFDFIAQYVPQGTVQIAKDYMELLYGDRVKEKLVQDLNPLNEIEISIVRRDGSYENRYLDFRFNRVMQDDRLSHILGSVTDVTRRVNLEKQLEESKEEQEAQLELLMRILHVDNKLLNSFVNNAETSLTEINSTMEEPGYGDHQIRSKISDITGKVHRLKGDSAALGLHKFEFAAHALEDELATVVKENQTITGKNLLPAITLLKDLFGELESMRSLMEKFSTNSAESQSDGSVSPMQVVQPDQNGLQNLVATVSERTGKRASLISYGLERDDLSDELDEKINSIAVQLIRNSIVHGCLPPEERVALGKTDFINIRASLIEDNNELLLTIRDDGEGFNEEKILARAVKEGLINQDQAEKMATKDVVRLAFSSGFSTNEKAEMDGGRGVGLGVVQQLAKDLGGRISLKHQEGQYSQFQVRIPKSA